MTVSLVVSLLAVAWLSVCALSDIRTRQVSNWLTLPAIPFALLAAWLTRESRGETLYEFVFHLVITTLPLLLAWRYRILGGADLKILVVLTLANPLLVVAAWIGVVIYFVGLLIVRRSRPVRFAGVPGPGHLLQPPVVATGDDPCPTRPARPQQRATDRRERQQ